MSTLGSSSGQLDDENVPPMSITTNGAISEGTGSPRVSTVGTDEPAVTKRDHTTFSSEAADYSAPGLDSLHWAGVKKRGDYDARSVASSMAAEKDDKSIYEEPAVGAVEEERSEDDEDIPEEIILPRAELSLDHDHSIAGSFSKQDSMTDVIEQPSPQQPDYRPEESRSVAYSLEAENGSIRPGSEDGEFEDVVLPTSMPQGAVSVASSIAADQISPRSSGIPHSPMSRGSVDMEPSPIAVGKTRSGSQNQYQSKTMRQLTTTDEDAENDRVGAANLEKDQHPFVENEPAVAEVEQEDKQEEEAPEKTLPESATTIPAAAITKTTPEQEAPLEEDGNADASTSSVAVVEHFEIEGASSGALPVSAPSSSGLTLTQAEPAQPAKVDMGPDWEGAFKGLLYYDGVDALGRPVVVLNADAVPPNMKSSALIYVKTHLEPLVNNGDYVVVFSAQKTRLPSLWIMSAYQNLPRPFRKNVQYVLLVRPTGFLRAVVSLLRPFISTKAHKKIKLVESLEEIGEATGGEVLKMHLGNDFLTTQVESERGSQS